MMTHKYLAIYLNDHLSGSVVALETLAQLEKTHAGTAVARFAATLHADVMENRHELETLMHELEISRSASRQAMGWFTEKATQLKLQVDDSTAGPLHLFEVLELVALGIQGQKGLWHALAVAGVPKQQGRDYTQLAQRATDQYNRVEQMRLEAAKTALTTQP